MAWWPLKYVPRLRCAILGIFLCSSALAANLNRWDEDPQNVESVKISPIRDNAESVTIRGQSLRLALKHYPRPGAQPVLLIHGLAQNDRCFDSAIARYSFARFLHAQGFDVWLGNFRNAGTPGFRSETPDGPHHWTVDDYAISDLPAVISAVRAKTGQAPLAVAHSLGAWAMEGYLAGLERDSKGRVRPNPVTAMAREGSVKGVVTIAGVYGVWWEKSISRLANEPIRSVTDYYHSNYELELLSGSWFLHDVVSRLPSLPLGWIANILLLPLDRIPFIGDQLASAYSNFQNSLIQTPILNMFYYAPNANADMVRLHGHDGLEDLGPKLLEQLGNAFLNGRTLSHFHGVRTDDVYDYGTVRKSLKTPMMFVGGDYDRMASAAVIYVNGYLEAQTPDKTFLSVGKFGHLDILTGNRAPAEVMGPVAKWLREHE